jgi:four helix bundle protein
MDQNPNKKYDLEERTYEFTLAVALYTKKLPRTVSNIEYVKQVVRSSGSPASNYIEANESLGKKDFQMRIKICRKEAKETALWLKLIINTNSEQFKAEGLKLIQEADELKKIFSSILNK